MIAMLKVPIEKNNKQHAKQNFKCKQREKF